MRNRITLVLGYCREDARNRKRVAFRSDTTDIGKMTDLSSGNKPATAHLVALTAPQRTNGDAAIDALHSATLKPLVDQSVVTLTGIMKLLNAATRLPLFVAAHAEELAAACVARIRTKFEAIPEAQRIAPPLEVVGPLLAHYPYVAAKPPLREMFEQLLVSSIDRERRVHPSYVEILKQLNPDEAKMLAAALEYFHDWHNGDIYAPVLYLSLVEKTTNSERRIRRICFLDDVDLLTSDDLRRSYTENFERLGILKFDRSATLTDFDYATMHSHRAYVEAAAVAQRESCTLGIVCGHVELTAFGYSLLTACIADGQVDQAIQAPATAEAT
jgi:hypothetical protein